MNFRFKILFSLLVYGFFLAIFTYTINYKINEAVFQKKNKKILQEYAKHLNTQFVSYFKDYHYLLAILKSSQFTKNFINDTDKKSTKKIFLEVAKLSDDIMQLRYIDNNGDEKIRIDRKSVGSTPIIVDKSKLQNKKSRYYFQSVASLKNGEFWFSKLDLNMEHGKIELPIKPVIRIGTPVFINDKKVGILIVNVFMKIFLEEVVKSDFYNTILLDKEGYTIVDKYRMNNWSRYLDEKKLYDKHLKPYMAKILQNKQFATDGIYARNLDIDNSENIKLVIRVEDADLTEQNSDQVNLLFVLMITLLISIPFIYFIVYYLSKDKQKVDILNENIYEELAQQTEVLSLFEQNGSVFFKWKNNDNRDVTSVSRSIETLSKYKQEEFALNRISYFDCIYEDDVQNIKDELAYAIKYGEYSFSYKPYRIVTKCGKIKWVHEDTVILINDHKEIIGYISHILDITDSYKKQA